MEMLTLCHVATASNVVQHLVLEPMLLWNQQITAGYKDGLLVNCVTFSKLTPIYNKWLIG